MQATLSVLQNVLLSLVLLKRKLDFLRILHLFDDLKQFYLAHSSVRLLLRRFQSFVSC